MIYSQWKIFYKFDYILPTNKHKKIGKNFLKKYFTSKITVCVVVLHAQHFDNKT